MKRLILRGATLLVMTLLAMVSLITVAIATTTERPHQASVEAPRCQLATSPPDWWTVTEADYRGLDAIARCTGRTRQELLDLNRWLHDRVRHTKDGLNIVIRPGDRLQVNPSPRPSPNPETEARHRPETGGRTTIAPTTSSKAGSPERPPPMTAAPNPAIPIGIGAALILILLVFLTRLGVTRRRQRRSGPRPGPDIGHDEHSTIPTATTGAGPPDASRSDRRRVPWTRGYGSLLGAIGRDVRAVLARAVAHRFAHVGVGLAVSLGLAWALLPRRDFVLLVIGLLIGLAACWFAMRRPTQSRVPAALQRDALIEGVAAGSLRLAGSLVPISITAIMADLHASKGAVAFGISLTSAMAVVVVWWSIRRLHRDSERSPSPGLVFWSFALVAVGLCGVALSDNVWLLATSLALMGVPVATNARVRYAAMARHSGREGTVQRISNRWSRVTSVGGLVVAGASIAFAPWGWRGTALAAAAFFIVLGFAVSGARVGLRAVASDHARWLAAAWRAVHGRRAVPSVPVADVPTNGREVDREQIKLWSVKRQLALILFGVATAQLARTSLEPVLASGGLGGTSSLFAAIIAGGAQIAMIPAIDRYAEGSNHSPRQMAFRAAVWALPAALIAPLAAATTLWWLTLPLAACWLAFVETGSGGTGSATRVGLNRSGQLASLYGLLSGYAGNTLGAAAAGWAGSAVELGALLLLGGSIAFGISLWTPRQTPTNRHPIRTTGTDISITIRRRRHREFLATIHDERGRSGGMELGDGDRLRSRRPHNEQRAAERRRMLDLSLWAGEAWWPHRWLASITGSHGRLADRWPQDRAAIIDGAFHGCLRWYGADELPFHIDSTKGGITIRVRLPRAMRLTWYPDKWLDQSELPRWQD